MIICLEGTRAHLEFPLWLKGIISGEHGIGVAKAEYLPMELSDSSIDLQTGIKKLFDPNMALNPGKIFTTS